MDIPYENVIKYDKLRAYKSNITSSSHIFYIRDSFYSGYQDYNMYFFCMWVKFLNY